MKRFIFPVLLLAPFLFSCLFQPASNPEQVPTATATRTAAPPVSDEIRFAFIRQRFDPALNVWAVFDKPGALVVNQAVLGESLPRLFHFSPMDGDLQPLAAQEMPSPVIQDGELFSATVRLRSDLKWTDGTAFTAQDAAFTANAVLRFELGYDWSTYYPVEYLARAEAIDAHTIKYWFTGKPNVGVWQYGILQAPIVQEKYWRPALQQVESQLPGAELRNKITETRNRLAVAQSDLEDLTAKVIALKVNGKQDSKTQGDYNRMQGEVVYLEAILKKYLEEYGIQLTSAQDALHQLDHAGEPLLGAWLPLSNNSRQWVNQANPDAPFGTPGFKRASYHFFDSEEEALAAFQKDQVDFILSAVDAVPPGRRSNPSYNARFLVLNPSNSVLSDPRLRAAISCLIDRAGLFPDALQSRALPLEAFVLSSHWQNPAAGMPCAGLDVSTRFSTAVKTLKDAGYVWGNEPTLQTAAKNLSLPDGRAFPEITLLAPEAGQDALRNAAARQIVERLVYFGIPCRLIEESLNQVVYALFSSGKYDMVLAGWRLSEYPAYLCDWFDGDNPLLYDSKQFSSLCGALRTEADMQEAKQLFARLQAGLGAALPFIPLFTVAQVDVSQNVSYPLENILNGWAGLAGAPSYANPAP